MYFGYNGDLFIFSTQLVRSNISIPYSWKRRISAQHMRLCLLFRSWSSH